MTPRDRTLTHGRVRVVDIGEGPALVLLHGLGGTWRNWGANIAGLARSHRVIALDLPGFGGSKPYLGEVTMERYVDTVIELLDALGIETATFVGNSMGGLLTIEASVRHPDRVSAAVLVCSGGLPLTSMRHRFVAVPQARFFNLVMRSARVRRAIVRSRLLRRLVGSAIVADPDALAPDELTGALEGLGAAGFGSALAAGQRYDARQRAGSIACPTLILWGRRDRLLPVAMGEKLHRLVPGSRLVVWDAAGHCPMLEHPARFDSLVTGFVAEQA